MVMVALVIVTHVLAGAVGVGVEPRALDGGENLLRRNRRRLVRHVDASADKIEAEVGNAGQSQSLTKQGCFVSTIHSRDVNIENGQLELLNGP